MIAKWRSLWNILGSEQLTASVVIYNKFAETSVLFRTLPPKNAWHTIRTSRTSTSATIDAVFYVMICQHRGIVILQWRHLLVSVTSARMNQAVMAPSGSTIIMTSPDGECDVSMHESSCHGSIRIYHRHGVLNRANWANRCVITANSWSNMLHTPHG